MKARGTASSARALDIPKISSPSSKAPEQSVAKPSEPGHASASEGGVAYQYAAVQQMTEHRENIEYQLTLRVITHDRPVRDAPISSSDSAPISPPVERKAGQGPAVPSTPGVRWGVPVTTSHGDGWEDKAWYLENPYYFMYAMLCNCETDEELHLLHDGKTRFTSGSCVSCLYHLKDIDGSHQGFFVFPDLSIRVESVYRLKLCLFETIGHTVHHCKSIYSAPFNVYTAKRFPGMEESTLLSKTFADQGLKVRVRKQPRLRRRSSKRKDGSRSDGSDVDNPAVGLSGDRRSPKRPRGSEEPPVPPIPPLPSSMPYSARGAGFAEGYTPSSTSSTPPRGSLRVPRPPYHHTAPPHAYPDGRLMTPTVPSGPYYEQERIAPGPSSLPRGEEQPVDIPISRSLPGRRGFERHVEDAPPARYAYGYTDAGRELDRMPPMPMRREECGYLPAPYRLTTDGEPLPLPSRYASRRHVDDSGAPFLPRGDGYPYYADEDARVEERRMRPPLSTSIPSGFRPAAGSMPDSSEVRRGSLDYRLALSSALEHRSDYQRSLPVAAHASRIPSPALAVADRQRLYISTERYPPAPGHSLGYAGPSGPTQLGPARAYVYDGVEYAPRRRPHTDERFAAEPPRREVSDIPQRSVAAAAVPPHEMRVPSRQLTPLDPAAPEARDRPTLPSIRDVHSLPSLRGSSRRASPVARLPRAESFYDHAPRYPSSRELDPSMRSVSATPPFRRHPSSSHLGATGHFQGTPLPRSPSLAMRQMSQFAPVPIRTLPALLSPDLERGRGARGGVPPAPPSGPDHASHYRSRPDERPRERDEERERVAREREWERERDARDRSYHPY